MRLSTATTAIAFTAMSTRTCAFAPATSSSKTASLNLLPNDNFDAQGDNQIDTEEVASGIAGSRTIEGQDMLGWQPDASKPCYGLPGAIAPLGFFDPLGFCKERSLEGVKRFREAEIMHGRVAMMATVGYLIGENTPTIAYPDGLPLTLANDQIPEVPIGVLFPFFLTINMCEAYRASKGWNEPGTAPLFTLRDNYYPGNLGFDPLGLKPDNAKDFEDIQAKELSNGRLAMLAAIGMMVQELVNGQPVLADLP